MAYTLEVVGADNRLVFEEKLELSGERDAWSYVVCCARRLKDGHGMRIRVRDETGGLLILTSVVAALLVDKESAA